MASRFSSRCRTARCSVDEVRHRLQGHHRRRQDRSEERRDVAGLADPDAAVRLRPRRCGQGSRTAGCSSRRYNTERATGKLEVTASQRDRDYIAAVDWRAAEKAIAEGKGEMIDGVKVIDPEKVPGLVYLLPCGKSPHGVDVSPDGKYIVASGKLQGVTTVFNFEKIQTAIRNKDFLRRRGRHPGAQVRIDQRRRGAGRPRSAAHAVRPRRLRLHVAVRGQRHREMEARHVGGRRQDPDVVLHRPPGGGRGRHGQPGRASTWSRSTSSRTAGTSRSGRRSPSRRSSSTSARRR